LSFSTESATSVTAISIYQAGSEKGDDGEGGVVYLGTLLLATCNDNGSSSATHTAINCLSNARPSVADPPKKGEDQYVKESCGAPQESIIRTFDACRSPSR
jgi:hypothetical protein